MNIIDSVDRIDLTSVNAALESNLRPVIRWSSPADVSSATTGNPIIVAHDLGIIPTDFAVTKWQTGDVWADENDRRMWSAVILVFHGSFATTTGRFTVKAGVQ